jgi:hypothetical protein
VNPRARDPGRHREAAVDRPRWKEIDDERGPPHYTECGRTPGYPHGHDDIHLVKQLC